MLQCSAFFTGWVRGYGGEALGDKKRPHGAAGGFRLSLTSAEQAPPCLSHRRYGSVLGSVEVETAPGFLQPEWFYLGLGGVALFDCRKYISLLARTSPGYQFLPY